MTSLLRATCVGMILLVGVVPGFAAPPSGGERTDLAGQPTAIEVAPAAVTLAGVRDARQLVVTGRYPNNQLRDLTHAADVKVEPADVVEVQEGLFLRGKKDG
ncbi:MAG: hypothetical protein JNK93_10610, partial [Planctomycetia bacterium]|nr:hypothetical protein [Planctomycetia bacterium]